MEIKININIKIDLKNLLARFYSFFYLNPSVGIVFIDN